MESVRKDVECTFGSLKARFRILRNPIEYHDQSCIDNVFFTCCIIHNILLTIDGLDSRWENLVGNFCSVHYIIVFDMEFYCRLASTSSR